MFILNFLFKDFPMINVVDQHETFKFRKYNFDVDKKINSFISEI